MKRTCYFLVFLLSFCVAEGFGQIDTASIEGRVADSSGASVVGATADVMKVETNYTYHAVFKQGWGMVHQPGTHRDLSRECIGGGISEECGRCGDTRRAVPGGRVCFDDASHLAPGILPYGISALSRQ